MTLLSKAKPRPRANTASVIKTASIPAPVRGLNFRDSLAGMKPADALQLDNVICRPGYVEVRAGWQPLVTGFSETVETLMPYTAVDGTEELFAAAGDGIFDATTPGTVGAAEVGSLSSAYWAHTQISNTAGNFLVAVNGIDNSQIYNGSTWANLSVTGIAITALSHVAVWKRRLWFVEKNSTSAWYLAADAISGAATEFLFSGVFRRGGYLRSIINWTVDGGEGLDDYFLAVSSEGEVAVYKGTDPASATTFALVGVYFVGAPIGQRYYAQFGGDVLLLTTEGLVPLSKYLNVGTADKAVFYSDRIQGLLSQEIAEYGSVQGWEIHVYFDQNFLLIQVPAGEVGSRYQYIMSTLTGAWSRFLVAPAVCWAVQGVTLYHGQATQVVDSWNSGFDDDTSISYTILPAFSDFGTPTVQKQFMLGRATVEADQRPTFQTTTLVDFNRLFIPVSLSVSAPSGAFWDVGTWDTVVWGGTTTIYRDWYSLNNLGYVGTQVIQGVSVGSITRFIAFDYSYQPGGLL